MLKITKTTNFRGESLVDEKVVKIFEARINTDTPENANITSQTVDVEKYLSNRELISAEQQAFEDEVCEMRQTLINSKTTEAIETEGV